VKLVHLVGIIIKKPEISSVAVTLEAALSSETSEQLLYHTRYKIQNTIISDIFI